MLILRQQSYPAVPARAGRARCPTWPAINALRGTRQMNVDTPRCLAGDLHRQDNNNYRISSVRNSGLLSCLSCSATSWSREIYFSYRGSLSFDCSASIQVIFRGRPTMPVNASHSASRFLPYQFGKSSPSAIAVCKSSSDAIFDPSMIKCIWLSSIFPASNWNHCLVMIRGHVKQPIR